MKHWGVAVLAGFLLWGFAATVRVATAPVKTSQQSAAPPPSQPPQPAPPAPAPKKSRFALDDEDEKKPQEAGEAGQKKSRFALEDEEETKKPEPSGNAYIGTPKCVKCHQKQAKAYYDGPHGRLYDERAPARDLGCETCHGPGRSHDQDPGAKGRIAMFPRMAPREATAACMTCHSRSQHANWQGSVHDARNVTCVSCHSMHRAKSQRGHLKEATTVETCAACHRDKAAKLQRTSHMPVREGKMDCTSCHNPHGSSNVRMLRTGNTVNESCVTCHAEKRGPFLWEHAPVTEKCTTCHDPHGSMNNRMLVTKETMLCQRCHVGNRHPATPYDGAALLARSNRLVNRGCLNCHQTIHGSNHPSGMWFQR
jgi:DmsE family decaheme c-type cytochrome